MRRGSGGRHKRNSTRNKLFSDGEGTIDITEPVTISATGHTYKSVVTDPTCTEAGYTTYTCSVCGDTYTTDETEALGHTETEAITENKVAATETKDDSTVEDEDEVSVLTELGWEYEGIAFYGVELEE